jgi:hypothetical protein
MKAFMDAFMSGQWREDERAKARLVSTDRLALAFFMGGTPWRSCFGAEVGRG